MKAILLLLLVVCVGYTSRTIGHVYKFPAMPLFPTMPLANYVITNEGVDLGRHLFYDSILSRARNLSCAGCHKQEYAFCDGPNEYSKGNNGVLQQRNTPSLSNLAWQKSFFWDGRANSIDEQVFHPVRDEMEMNLNWEQAIERIKRNPFYKAKFRKVFGDALIDSCRVANVIAQFERTLLSYRSKYDMVLAGKDTFTKDEADGFVIVNDMTMGDCLHCHTTDADPLGSTFEFSNNGLDNITDAKFYKDAGRGKHTNNLQDYGKFKIPSLRNLAFTAPYMHDGRFKTLEQVIDFYSEGVKMTANIDSKMEFAHTGGAHFTKDEKRKIIAFLLTMSDSAFISDPAFSNPFKKKQ